MNKRNLELIADFYEFTMANGYLEKNMNDIAYFDVFFRKIPDNGGFVIFAGLEQIIDFIKDMHFSEEDIEYLKQQNIFSEKFINYLRNFKFTGDIWSIPEGTVVFPNEPLITVRAPIIEAQLLETFLLLTVNHQSLIATKTRRIVNQARNCPVMEFGARRAHGPDAAIFGARAAIIGGAVGTSCSISAKEFSIPVSGTMAHSWIQSFDSEYEAFKAYAETYPTKCIFLVDTYNTLESGIPNAIRVFDEILKPKGVRPIAVRLDSGDLAYLSKEARKLLDSAGYEDCKICATNSLNENLISSLFEQEAKIDLFGVGENLITAKSDPVFGGVYKLVALEKNGNIIPKIKISENVIKVTNPSYKKIYRFYSKEDNHALADVIALHNESISNDEYTIFDPANTWKKKTLKNYYVKELQTQIFKDGKLIYTPPTLKEIAEYSKKDLETFWSEIKRIDNPHKYFVDLSQNLWDLKQKMLQNN